MEDKLQFLEQEANELYKKIEINKNSEELIEKLFDLLHEMDKVVGDIKIEEWKSLNQSNANKKGI